MTWTQPRSLCYVDDLIDGLITLMRTADDFTGPVNLGNPNEFAVRTLAEKVLALTRSKSTLEFKPLPRDDPVQRQPDITLAKSALAWRPSVRLEDGRLKTNEYFRALASRNAGMCE